MPSSTQAPKTPTRAHTTDSVLSRPSPGPETKAIGPAVRPATTKIQRDRVVAAIQQRNSGERRASFNTAPHLTDGKSPVKPWQQKKLPEALKTPTKPPPLKSGHQANANWRAGLDEIQVGPPLPSPPTKPLEKIKVSRHLHCYSQQPHLV